jgi:predicted DNA binding protein
MNRSFYITYALYKGECILTDILRNIMNSSDANMRGDEIVGSFIGVRVSKDHRLFRGILRISYKELKLLKNFLMKLRRSGVSYKIIHRGRGSIVIIFNHNKTCNYCPLIYLSGNAVPKTCFLTSLGLLFELISEDKISLDEELFHILFSDVAEKVMDYMLTPREQEILYYAYFRGYYDQPRKIHLTQLAEELNISKSALNEILRSAERKIVTAYMRHDMPHLVIEKILGKINIYKSSYNSHAYNITRV